jgi:hypothetical protein
MDVSCPFDDGSHSLVFPWICLQNPYQQQPNRPQNKFDDRRRDDRGQHQGTLGRPSDFHRDGDSFRDQNQSYKRQRGRGQSFDGQQQDRRNKPFDKRGGLDNRDDRSRYQDARLPQPFTPPGQQQQYPPAAYSGIQQPGMQQQTQQYQQQPSPYPGQQQQQYPPSSYPGQQPPMGYAGQQQQAQPYHGQQQPLPYGSLPGNPPPPPPRSAPASLAGLPGMSQYQPQQQSMMQRAPAPQQPAMYPPDQSQFVPRMMGGTASPSSFVGQYPQQPNNNISQHQYNQAGPGMRGDLSQPQQQQPQQPYTAPIVYGIHAQQLQQQQTFPPMRGRQDPQPQQSYAIPPNVGQQQNLNNYAAPPSAYPGQQMQGLYAQQGPAAPGAWNSQPPVDILGLADKAASAVQALASQNKLHMSHVPSLTASNPMSHSPYGSMPSTNGAQQQQQQHMAAPYPISTTGGDASRRRTTASLTELPVMVQYAVQVRATQESWMLSSKLEESSQKDSLITVLLVY